MTAKIQGDFTDGNTINKEECGVKSRESSLMLPSSRGMGVGDERTGRTNV